MVLTDIYMPEMDGLEFIRECRRIDKDVAIIAVPGGGKTFELDMLSLAQKMGADHVLEKPVWPKELSAAVELVLQAH